MLFWGTQEIGMWFFPHGDWVLYLTGVRSLHTGMLQAAPTGVCGIYIREWTVTTRGAVPTRGSNSVGFGNVSTGVVGMVSTGGFWPDTTGRIRL